MRATHASPEPSRDDGFLTDRVGGEGLNVKLGCPIAGELAVDVMHSGDGGEIFVEVRIHDEALLG